MSIVYQHIRKDTSEVFYVGIGKDKSRAFEKDNRNNYWHNIVNKCGYSVEIIVEGVEYDEAKKIEIELISKYGRRDLGLGPLVNLTDGGDGIQNLSKECREKIKVGKLGDKNPTKRDDVKKKLKESWTIERKEKQGKNHSKFLLSISKKLSEDKLGEKNPMFGVEPWNKGIKTPQKIVTCDKCGKSGGISNMKRFHFEKCKIINNE